MQRNNSTTYYQYIKQFLTKNGNCWQHGGKRLRFHDVSTRENNMTNFTINSIRIINLFYPSNLCPTHKSQVRTLSDQIDTMVRPIKIIFCFLNLIKIMHVLIHFAGNWWSFSCDMSHIIWLIYHMSHVLGALRSIYYLRSMLLILQ